ncbi:MAG: zinc ribbon domain-containing protein [Limisphaerales bacterium]
MALIQCHECSGQVSDHARTCPHCGAPVIATIKRRQKAVLIGLGIRLAVAVVVLVAIWILVHRLGNQALPRLNAIQQQQTPPH